MAKVKLSQEDIKLYELTPEGRAYLEYNDKIGGDPIGLMVSIGYPDGFEKLGGVIATYKECIKEGKTWESLLNYKEPPDDVII